ncbi:hypothetical protein L218DRAFT_983912 [Marasmius fiardii PR-910]|nr:hypothetical protein L218DRAFT_983912 [Marasmius fiardii PR-910]
MDVNDLEVQFNPSRLDLDAWAERIGLGEKPEDEELQKMYTRAREFLLDKRDDLVTNHGWVVSSNTHHPEDYDMLFVLEKDVSFSYDGFGLGFQTIHDVSRLEVPVRITDILDTWEARKWGGMFSDTNIFEPTRAGEHSYCFKDQPTALSDIFHLIQTLVPGLLVVVDRKNGGGDGEFYGGLPDDTWMQQNKNFLSTVMGTERFTTLLGATRRLEGYREDDYSYRHYDSERSESPSDLIAIGAKGESFYDHHDLSDEEAFGNHSSPYTSTDRELGYNDDFEY